MVIGAAPVCRSRHSDPCRRTHGAAHRSDSSASGERSLGVAGWWLALIGGTVLAMKVFDRLARRVLPAAWLLRTTMAFPDGSCATGLVTVTVG